MKNYQDILVPSKEIFSITCDCCGKTYKVNKHNDEFFEAQEFLHIDFIGGYASVFEDGNRMLGDFCQHCVKKLLGKYLTVIEN